MNYKLKGGDIKNLKEKLKENLKERKLGERKPKERDKIKLLHSLYLKK